MRQDTTRVVRREFMGYGDQRCYLNLDGVTYLAPESTTFIAGESVRVAYIGRDGVVGVRKRHFNAPTEEWTALTDRSYFLKGADGGEGEG